MQYKQGIRISNNKVNTIVVQKGDIVKVVTTSKNAYDWYKDLIATLPKHKIELSMIQGE